LPRSLPFFYTDPSPTAISTLSLHDALPIYGRFRTRGELLEVSGVGEATFTQAAGFLKIAGGDEPLDATWIHPESYPAAILRNPRSEEHTSELQSLRHLVCRLLLEKKKNETK